MPASSTLAIAVIANTPSGACRHAISGTVEHAASSDAVRMAQAAGGTLGVARDPGARDDEQHGDTPMIDPNSDSASKNDAARNIAGTPRCVKASGIIVLVLVLLFVILHLAGRGRHGGHTPPVHDVGAHQ